MEDYKVWKKSKIDELRQYHKDLINDLGIEPKHFDGKTPYIHNGVQTVLLFGNEFLRKNGFYFELINGGIEPLDPERKVYRVPYNPDHKEEYEEVIKGEYTFYRVKLEELKTVDPYAVAISKSSAIVIDEKEKISKNSFGKTQNFSVSLEDCPYSEMTIRDYMAIHTGKPVSLKDWLNELVTKTSK